MRTFKVLLVLGAASCSSLFTSSVKAEDSFGVWSEIGVEKSLNKKWSMGLDGNFRSQTKMRGGLAVSLGYKPIKNLKLSAGYSFITSYKVEKTKQKPDEYEIFDYGGEEPYEYLSKKGYNTTSSYWSPRHRVNVDVTGNIKLGGHLRLSLRERYQYTYRQAQTVSMFRHRETFVPNLEFDEDWNAVPITEPDEVTDEWRNKSIAAEDAHVLRSRLKLEYERKHLRISPFVSVELHNSLDNAFLLEKVRSSIGFDYKISKHHSIGMSYILSCDIFDEEEPHDRLDGMCHALGLGYYYSF